MKHLSDDWFALGANYYRKLVLYSLDLKESLNFDDFFISIGGYGGYIVFLQRPKSARNSLLMITSASGKMIAQTVWKDAPPVNIAWSDSEEIAIVQKSGYLSVLDFRGVFNRRFSFGKEAENTQIVEAKFFTHDGRTAVAAVTGSSQIFIATSLERPRILAISTEIPFVNRGFVWQVISSALVKDSDTFKGPWVLLASNKQIHRMGVGKCQKVEIPYNTLQHNFSAFHKLAVSPDEVLVAFYLDSSVLLVTCLEDTSKIVLDLGLSQRAAALGRNGSHISTLPSDLVWLDNTTVALQWKNFVVIVDMDGNIYEFFYPSFAHIQVEVDGLRVLTPTIHELIQRVPHELESLGRIGASCPSVLLLSAYREWKAGSGRAHDFLRLIQSPQKMYEAISSCLEAAGHGILASSDTQISLLAAAHFGRGFLSVMLAAPEAFDCGINSKLLDELPKKTIELTITMRLLNSIAVEWIGMALTWKQFELLGPVTLLNRLLIRQHYPLAIELVRAYQKLPSVNPECIQVKVTGLTRILCHWVTRLPSNPNPPNDFSNSSKRHIFGIIDRCCGAGTLSFAEVAETAIRHNHLALAEWLLDLEPRVSAQIPLLMRLKKYSLALSRAVESGDTDHLLLGVLQTLQEKEVRLEPTAFSLLLRQHPVALAFYRQHFEGEGGLAKGKLATQTLAVLQYADDPILTVKNEVLRAFASKDPSIRASILLKAKDTYQQMRLDFFAQTCEETVKLANFHKRLDQQRITAPYFRLDDRASGSLILPLVTETAAFRWQGSSVNSTYTRLVAANAPTTERTADQLRREFKMPEKRIAYLRLIGLALANNNSASAWTEIERMTFAKRPVIPLDIFVKVYLDAGRKERAVDVIAKLPLEQKIRFLVLMGQSHEAINLATQERSDRLLHLIQRLLHKTDRTTADQVGAIRTQLS